MSVKKASYQQLSAELDTIMNSLQSAELDLDEAVTAYERGMQIVKQLETYLRQTENKVTKITANFSKTLE